jgi:hypothetical protein
MTPNGRITFDPGISSDDLADLKIAVIGQVSMGRLNGDGAIHLLCDYHVCLEVRVEHRLAHVVSRPIDQRDATPNWPKPEPIANTRGFC